jgi:hypothetical protein
MTRCYLRSAETITQIKNSDSQHKLHMYYLPPVITVLIILWHVDPLLGNDHEISNYTQLLPLALKQQQRKGVFCTVCPDGCASNNGICHATTKQQSHCNRGTVFSMRSMPKCYKQESLGHRRNVYIKGYISRVPQGSFLSPTLYNMTRSKHLVSI